MSLPLKSYMYNHKQTTKDLAGVTYSSIQSVYFVKFGHMFPKLNSGYRQKQYGDSTSLQFSLRNENGLKLKLSTNYKVVQI